MYTKKILVFHECRALLDIIVTFQKVTKNYVGILLALKF